jgi:hypothetical protein
MSDQNATYRPRCIYLCCKSMMVFGENFEQDPDYQSGMTEFWCTQTSKGQGPDDGAASLDLCSNKERTCFCEF